MASTKQSSQSVQASPWRHHVLVRLVPILALGVTAIYLNGFSSDDAQGRIGMDKLLNEPVLKDEPFLINEPVLKETEQQEQEGGVKNAPVLKETVHDSIRLPMDPVATPSTKAAKAEGGGKGGKSKEKSKEKSKGAKAEGAKAEKHDGKSKGGKSASKSKGGKSKSKSKSKGAKAEGAKAEKHDGKAGKASAKGGKSKEKSKGGAKAEKKSAKATATTEKIALDVQKEMEDEEVEAEYIIEDAE